MGRKKKITEPEVKQEVKVEETKKPLPSTIGYQGKINVKVQRGNKIVSSKTYHNTGSIKLFHFLCECLAGNYYEDLRPVRLRLLQKDDQDDPAKPVEWGTTPATPFSLTYTNVAAVKNDNTSYSTVFEFKVPYTFILADVYKAALYTENVPNNDDWSAIFGFFKEDGKSWDPISVSNENKQYYTLVLTWTMTISNQNVKGE